MLTEDGPRPDVPSPDDYGPNDLWIDETSVDITNGVVNLLLHGTIFNHQYQLEFKTNLNQPDWALSQIIQGNPGTNPTPFDPVAINGNTEMFFRAHHTNVVVSVEAVQDGIETNSAFSNSGQPGIFRFSAENPATGGLANDVVVRYRISGVASNGLDYTNISGIVTIPASTGSTNVFIQPIALPDLDFDETVTLAPFQTNAYLIRPDKASATIVIHDNFGTNIFLTVASGFDFPTGIDYDPATDSLIVAVNGAGAGTNFWRINTNTISPWSTVTQAVSELKFATVKQTAGGFTNGQIYFNSSEFSSSIGRIATNGSSWTNDWTTLPFDQSVQGGLYVDQSGVFGNDLIAVTGTSPFDGSGVWRVKSDGQATNVAFLPGIHCEGVITLTNDVARWGPWAGKIITGAETTPNNGRNLIFAIDTNGTVSTFDLGIISLGPGADFGLSCEHFDIIPPNQDLYLIGEEVNGKLLKLSGTLLTNYVGDLLITQGGLWVGQRELYIVHWNGSDFIPHGIPLTYYSLNNTNFNNIEEIEGVIFAPIVLDAQ